PVEESEGNSSHREGCEKLLATSKDVRKTQIQEAVKSGQLSHVMKGIKKERTKSFDTTRGESKKDKGIAPTEAPILNWIEPWYGNGKSRNPYRKEPHTKKYRLRRKGNHIYSSGKGE
ncbi:hypothetical protein Tco_0372865, partial [Tanacetum coccineum]